MHFNNQTSERCESFQRIVEEWSDLINWRVRVSTGQEHGHKKVYTPSVLAIVGKFDNYNADYVNLINHAAVLSSHIVIGILGNSTLIQNKKVCLESHRYVNKVHIIKDDDIHRFLIVSRPHYYLNKLLRDSDIVEAEKMVDEKIGTKLISIQYVNGRLFKHE